MQIHQLQPKHKERNKKRVGRGGRKGTYSGKGMKGQKSRAGRKMVPLIRELIKRYPKLKGYRGGETLAEDTIVVNLLTLEKIAKDGEVITPEFLQKKGVVQHIKGKTPKVKILGTGKLTKKLAVENCTVSATAKAAIEKAGGTIKA
jgi:large subunit ribosomal protein L15